MRALGTQPVVLGEATDRPQPGALQRVLLVCTGVHQSGQLVEGEDDVGAELVLDLHRHLRREPVRRPVEMRLEGHAVVVDAREPFAAVRGQRVVGVADLHRDDLLEARPEGHDLEAAAVGVGEALPVHELAEAPGLVDDLRAGLQVQVVGVGQHRLRPEVGDRLGQDGLHRGLGAHRDEGGRGCRLGSRDHPGAPRCQGGADGERTIGDETLGTAHRSIFAGRRRPSQTGDAGGSRHRPASPSDDAMARRRRSIRWDHVEPTSADPPEEDRHRCRHRGSGRVVRPADPHRVRRRTGCHRHGHLERRGCAGEPERLRARRGRAQARDDTRDLPHHDLLRGDRLRDRRPRHPAAAPSPAPTVR